MSKSSRIADRYALYETPALQPKCQVIDGDLVFGFFALRPTKAIQASTYQLTYIPAAAPIHFSARQEFLHYFLLGIPTRQKASHLRIRRSAHSGGMHSDHASRLRILHYLQCL